MKVTPLRRPLAGERILGAQPTLAPDSQLTWRRRTRVYTGRSLSDIALTVEQDGRGGHLATRGQAMSPGVVSGLELALDLNGRGAGAAGTLHLGAGTGLAHSGEDVVVPFAVPVQLGGLPVHAPPSLLNPSEPSTDTASGTLSVRRIGRSLGEVWESWTGTGVPDALLAGFVVIQPVTVEVRDEPASSACDDDPSDAAFEDWQLVDGCRLVFSPWPTEWSSLPPPGSQWRNRLAYEIFRLEATLTGTPPWAEVGVPVAMLGFDATGVPLFVDRFSVVRAGGQPRQVPRPLVGGGTPPMWQARMQQFAEHIGEPGLASSTMREVAGEFRFLPPAGLLPKETLNLAARTSDFFTPGYQLSAVPVPVEQLDVALVPSAGGAPFDLFVPDQAEVLVPVPQSLYEPRLLLTEAVDPEFQQSIDAFLTRRGKWLARRTAVRAKANALNRAATARDLIFPSPDPGQLDDQEPEAVDPVDPNDPALAAPEEAFGTVVKDGRLAVDAVEALHADLNGRRILSDAELAKLDQLGVEAFIDLLDAKIRVADDRVDVGFLHAQTSMYRLRQVLLGADAASRLATSPALASIAHGETAVATNLDIARFLETAKRVTTPGPVVPDPDVLVTAEGDALVTGPALPPLLGAAAPIGTVISAGGKVLQPIDPETVLGSVVSARLVEPPDLKRVELETSAGVGKLFVGTVEQESISAESPLPGSFFRTATVAQRLATPPANQAQTYALASKVNVLTSALDLDINIDDLALPGFQDANHTDVMRTVKDIKENRATLLGQVAGGVHDPVGSAQDEAAYFSTSVRSIDHSIAILRIIEGRVQSYKSAVQACRRCLVEVGRLAGKARERLGVIEDNLAEARHDVSVGRALLAEETQRVAGINARRAQILAEHVSFLAYRRPRTARVVLDVPARPIDPGLTEEPVPACLAREVEPPVELRTMVELVRDAPLRWFLHAQAALGQLTRPEDLHLTLAAAVSKTLLLPIADVPVSARVSSGPFTGALTKAMTAQSAIVVQHRLAKTAVDLGKVATLTWTGLHAEAHRALSLGDLIDGAHGKAQVAQRAAKELHDITAVATCLYDLFGDVLPAIRLLWAERLSQFDDAVSLRQLSSLPRWGEVPFVDRREGQMLVDWLYGRIDRQLPEAVALMDTLVRVTVLLASHAPVNQIISGKMARPSIATLGDRIDVSVLTAHLSKVNIGMRAEIYDGARVVASAVVEDLAGSAVTAKVVMTATPSVNLAAGAAVRFSPVLDRPF